MINQIIAPFRTGLITDLEPWIAPPDGFVELNNHHLRHGYVSKRQGFRELGELQTLSATATITGITNAADGEVTTAAPHGYSTGYVIYISGVTGMTQVNDILYTITVTGASTFTLGVDTSLFGVYAGAGTAQRQIPDTDRVMGLDRYIDAQNAKVGLAWNTTRANKWNGVTNQFDVLDAAPIMDGGEEDFIVTANWQSVGLTNRIYFTNGKVYDGASLNGIRYYDGSGTGNTTQPFTPNDTQLDTAGVRFLWGGKLLFVMKQRLVVLHTFERDGASTSTFPQRARWCQAKGPSNWDDVTPGGGGFVDAPTGDQILTAQKLQDNLIVFFTDSVWKLSPTSNPALPFRWDQLNNFRASNSKMGSTGYDRVIRSVGVRGIVATDGVTTQRVDNKIEDFTINEIEAEQVGKVFCERSYATKRWWTLYPAIDSSENSAALIWDEDTQAYSIYDIAMNCLGYGNLSRDFALQDFTAANDLDLALQDFGEETCRSYFWQDNQEIFLGGSVGGFVYVMETENDDAGQEISASFRSVAWNPFKEQNEESQLVYLDMYVDTHETAVAELSFFKNEEEGPYIIQQMDFLPNLGFIASITGATAANPVVITAPQHGLTTNDDIYIYGVRGMTAVNGGPYQVTVISTSTFSLNGIDGSAFGTYTTGGQIVLNPFYQTKVWKRVKAGGIGFQHSFKLEEEGTDTPYRIHAFKPVFGKVGGRLEN